MNKRKKIVRGGQKGFDSCITQLVRSGWKVVRTEIINWANGKKSFIGELEKQ